MPKIQWIAANSGNYTKGGNTKEYIVVHNTGNTASAYNEAQYSHNDQHPSSYHYTLDGGGIIYQTVSDDDTAWTVGAWSGATQIIRNNQSINIEVCSNETEFTRDEITELRWLVCMLMEKYGIDASHVVRHYDCHTGHKQCPAYYVNTARWEDLRGEITSCDEESWDGRGQEIAGDNRYQTASRIVTYTNDKTINSMVVVSGETFADALSASGLAGFLGCPILINDCQTGNQNARNCVANAQTRGIITIGGQVDTRFANTIVENISGSDRYETCLKIMEYAERLDNASKTLVVCSGDGFADGLSIASYAWHEHAYVALVTGNEFTSGIRKFIEEQSFENAVIVGGEGVVSQKVESWLKTRIKIVERVSGANRYLTNLECARLAGGWETVYVASGENFPDGLVGGASAGRTDSPLLLVSKNGDGLDATCEMVKEHAKEIKNVIWLGGLSSVNAHARNMIADAASI